MIHTLGYPLKHEEFGGAFIYAMPGRQLSLGFVVGLDYKDPLFDPHMAFNRFKQHPFVSALLDGGQMIRYGAKALPEGGWNTVPRVYMDGAPDRGRCRRVSQLDAPQRAFISRCGPACWPRRRHLMRCAERIHRWRR